MSASPFAAAFANGTARNAALVPVSATHAALATDLLAPEFSAPAFLPALDAALRSKASLAEQGAAPSPFDAFVYGALTSLVGSAIDVAQFPSVVRWANFIAAALQAEGVAPVITVPLPPATLFDKPPTDDSSSSADPALAEQKAKAKKAKEEARASQAAASAAAAASAVGVDVVRMKVVVGKVVAVAVHPTESRMYVMQVDVGAPEPLQVVSGVADIIAIPDLLNTLIAVITNLKVGDVKGVRSAGRSLVATSADGTHKEFVRPAASCAPGEVITYAGAPAGSAPDAELNAKRFHNSLKAFGTNEQKQVMCQNAVLTTSAGPLTADTVVNGTVA